MGWFRRFTRRVREFFVSPEPPPEPPPGTGKDSDDFGDWSPVEQDLPPDWKFEGLYFANRPKPLRKVVNKDPSDWQISQANAIIVSHYDPVIGVRYFTIHGANDRKQVGRLITTVTIPESP